MGPKKKLKQSEIDELVKRNEFTQYVIDFWLDQLDDLEKAIKEKDFKKALEIAKWYMDGEQANLFPAHWEVKFRKAIDKMDKAFPEYSKAIIRRDNKEARRKRAREDIEIKHAKKKEEWAKQKNLLSSPKLLLISIFLGWLGIDRFMTGQKYFGILKLHSFGGYGIWWLIDIVLIATKKIKIPPEREYILQVGETRPIKKIKWIKLLLVSYFLGFIGFDRYMMGHVGLAVLKFYTFGGIGAWWLIDFILIATKKIKGVEWA